MQRPLTRGIPGSLVLIALLAPGTISMRAASAPASAKTDRVLMEEMTMTEVRAAIAAGKTTVLIFNGSTEQTGPHVVLGKHNFKARYLGQRIARELGNAWSRR